MKTTFRQNGPNLLAAGLALILGCSPLITQQNPLQASRSWTSGLAFDRTTIVSTTFLDRQQLEIQLAQVEPDTTAPRIMGVQHCAKCHASDGTGRQFQAWEKGPHARAFKTLASKEAGELADKLGITTHPQETLACLKCHVTGVGVSRERLGKDFDLSRGVQCETCHGPGEFYGKIEHMLIHQTARELGLNEPSAKTCKECHSKESPTYKSFDFASAVAKIRHPLPTF